MSPNEHTYTVAQLREIRENQGVDVVKTIGRFSVGSIMFLAGVTSEAPLVTGIGLIGYVSAVSSLASVFRASDILKDYQNLK